MAADRHPASHEHFGFTNVAAVARERAYVTAHVAELAVQDIDITLVLRWTGDWASYQVPWPAVGLTATARPELTVVCLGPGGEVHVAIQSGFFEENVPASPDHGPQIHGALREARFVGDHCYAVGMGRQVYRRRGRDDWVRIDYGIAEVAAEDRFVGFNSIHGLNERRLYAVGWHGEIWMYEDERWIPIESPTNVKLQHVLCVDDRTVYACGQSGVILRGSGSRWETVPQDLTAASFRCMAWFDDRLWLASTDQLFRLEDGNLLPVDIDGRSFTTGKLSAGDGVLWSVGAEHIFRTQDGHSWQRMVVP